MTDTVENKPTVAGALRYLLENEDHIDHMKVAQDLVIRAPFLFFELISEISPTELMARLVKADPSTFMEFVGRRANIFKNGGIVIKLLINGEKVPAIKKIREFYELGLRDAKDVVDNLTEMLYTEGLVKTGYTGAGPISTDNRLAFDELVTFIPKQVQP